MATLFFSYSHADEELRNRLEKHLVMLKRQGLIDTWHDRRLIVGEEIDYGIAEELEKADIILLLVSPDFLASSYCYDREMTRAMERNKSGATHVIPVILRPCDWHTAPFGRLLAAPTDGKPVTKFADYDEAFLDITTSIRKFLEKANIITTEETGQIQHKSMAIPTAVSTGPRSSNMRIRKTFSDAEKDSFLTEVFDFLARFFEGSLQELQKRNPEVQTTFRRIDANQFTAVAYVNGKAISRCRIFMGQGMYAHGIAYSSSDRGDNSFNDSLSVEADEQGLFLRTLGMSMRSSRDETRLTYEGAAEAYWERFVEPMQR